MSYIKVGEENGHSIELYFTDRGSGDPVVLIHGYPFSGVAFEKQETKLLDGGFRVITYDRRGFGKSDFPAEGFNYDVFARDLSILLNHLNLSNVTLVGHSMGTGEITRYLANFGSQRIERAVLISCLQPFLLKTDDNPEGVDRGVFEEIKSSIQGDRFKYMSDFLDNFYNAKRTLGDKLSEEKRQADWNLAVSASPLAIYACVDTWLEDFREDLEANNVPTLIIHGDEDNVLPFDSTAKRLKDELQNARLVTIEGGPHGILWTHADRVSEEILSFVREAGQVSGARARPSSNEGASLQ